MAVTTTIKLVNGRIPLAPRVPLLGSLPWLLSDRRFEFLCDNARDLGGLYCLDLGTIRTFVVTHPELASHVFVSNAQAYEKGGGFWAAVRELMGNGLPVSDGELWRRQRRMLQPEFNQERIERQTEMIGDIIDEFLVDLQRGPKIRDIQAWTTELVSSIVLRTLFSTSIDYEAFARVHAGMEIVANQLLLGIATHSLPHWVPLPGRRAFLDAVATTDEIVMGIIAERRRSGVHGQDLLGRMLDLVDDETQQSMSDRQLRDEAVALYVAGYETTASAIAFVLWKLAERPHFVEKLREELARNEVGERPTGADLNELKLLNQFVYESLRILPPIPVIPRQARVDDELAGQHIPAGSMVLIDMIGLHHNPTVWPDPSRFDPSRFEPENAAKRHRMAWMPFGIGQRMCLGKAVAMLEAKLVVAMLCRRFDLKMIASRPPKLQLKASLRTKDGIWVELEPRPS